MKTLNCQENTPSAEILQAAEGEGVVLMRDGHAVALIVPFDDDDLAWYTRERDPAFLASIAQAREQVRQGRTRAHEDLKRELGLA
jgi:antitoxin (DNA-binding transcriptional repressor) of toxin-antitoxin stability system